MHEDDDDDEDDSDDKENNDVLLPFVKQKCPKASMIPQDVMWFCVCIFVRMMARGIFWMTSAS